MLKLDLKSLQTSANSDNSQETEEQNIVAIQENTAESQEQNEKTSSLKPAFSFSLSDFTGVQESTAIEEPKEEIPQVVEDEKPTEQVSSENRESFSIFSNNNTELTPEVSIETVSITQDNLEKEVALPKLGISLTQSQDTESASMDLSSQEESVKEENNQVLETEENKEFFSGFNILDEFSLDDEMVISKKEENVVQENVASKGIELPKNETIEISPVQEENVVQEELLQETATIESQIISTESSEEIIDLSQENNNQVVTESLEETSVTTSNDAVILEPQQDNVTQIKNQLSGERKLSGLSIFKKKSVIAGIGIFIIGSISIGLIGMGNGDHGKSNIGEINGKPPIGAKKDNSNNHQMNNNIVTGSGDIDNISPVEGVDYKVIKNKKKNVKKNKTNSGGIIDNTQSNESLSGETIEISTGEIQTPEQNINEIQTNSGEINSDNVNLPTVTN